MAEYLYKQMIIIRRDLNMRKGKMIAQGAHASLSTVLSIDTSSPTLARWLDNGQAKIAVSVDSEEELLKLYTQARDAGLPTVMITDAGHTEFHGVPTKTCIAIGPALVKIIDRITGHLKLL